MSAEVLPSGSSNRSNKRNKLEALKRLGDLLVCDIWYAFLAEKIRADVAHEEAAGDSRELLQDPHGLPCLHKFCG